MKKLLVLFFALLPSIVLAAGDDIRPSDDWNAPAMDNPCVRDNGPGFGVSEGMVLSMRLPTMMVDYAINAVSATEKSGTVSPCPIEHGYNSGGTGEPVVTDPLRGFDSDNSTLIIGD